MSPVPTGTVDLVTTTVPGAMHPGQLAHRFEHEGQVGMAVAAPRGGADRDEHRLGLRDPVAELFAERQPAVLDIGFDQRFEARFPDWHLPRVEAVDLGGVLVDAAHFMPEVGEARAGNEAYITSADHRDTHACS